jgi:hypothetical protein
VICLWLIASHFLELLNFKAVFKNVFISFPLAIQFTKDVEGRFLLRYLVPSDNLQTLIGWK